MTERFLEERPTIEQTINTFRVAADMFLAGKELAFQRLHTYPYIPDNQELAEHITKSVATDLHSLTEWQRSFLAANGFMQTYALLERRADYQKKFMLHPVEVTENLLSALWRSTNWKVKLDPNKSDFVWSLFSVALVTEKEEFEKAAAYYVGKNSQVAGFVSLFATELGRMPIVMKNKDYKNTVWHEDIHTFHLAMSYEPENIQLSPSTPEIERAALDKDIQLGDLAINQFHFEEVLEMARHQMRLELPAALWSREMPVVDILQTTKYRDLQFAFDTLINCIYSDAEGFSEAEQITRHFDAQKTFLAVDLERRTLLETARQGIKNYTGAQNRWDWTAARATVMPPGFSTHFFKAVVLGKGVKLDNEPTINFSKPLAITLITHASRKIQKELPEQCDQLPKELVPRFLDIIVEIFSQKKLFESTLEHHTINLHEAKQKLIHYATKIVPQGFRGKTEKELNERLIV